MKPSIMDQDSCRGRDAVRVWNSLMIGEWTIGDLCIPTNRGVRYIHDLCRSLQDEGRVKIGAGKRVRDKKVTVIEN